MAEKEYIDLYECRDDFYATVLDILSEDNTNDRANQIIDAFDCLPAADVEPVRHGHWISLDDYFEDAQCSECGDALVIGDCSFNDFCECYNYCPNCGAKMDGGEGE